MNERIVKLFIESVDSNYIPVPVEDHMPSWTEKFAELLLKECMDITDAHTEVFQTDRDKALIEHIKKSVKQHFGVEE